MRLRVHMPRGALATITPDVSVVPPLAEQPPSMTARRVGHVIVLYRVLHKVLDEDATVLRAVLPPSARQLRRREQALELAPISVELAPISLELVPISLELGLISLELGPISLELGPISLELGPISLEVRAELQSRQARCLRCTQAAEQRRLDETRQPVREAQRLRPYA
jgi:hypothetical protein